MAGEADQSGSSEGRRRTPRMSLRLRLTLWMLAIFTVIQLTLGTIVFLYERASISRFFSENLVARSRSIMTAIASGPVPPSNERLIELANEQRSFFMFERFGLVIYDDSGAVVATSLPAPPSLSKQDLDATLDHLTPQLRRRRLEGTNVPAGRDGLARAVMQSFAGGDGRRYVLLAATGDRYAQEMTARVTHSLAITAPIGLIAAAAAGWAIAGIATSPLHELRSIAQRLSPESIGERLEVSDGDVEIMRLERDLERARERIAQALRTQERFMSNVSHELKTPIAVVLAEAQTIPLDQADPDVRSFVGSVREEMRRLGRLVDSFLTLTRVREGRAQTIDRRCMVNELILESIAHCRPMARQHAVAVKAQLLESEADVDLEIRGDPELLRTMLDNLIRNAVRFSTSGSEVRVAANHDDGMVRLRVVDSGSGIPEDMLARIFDRFAQAPSEERRGRGHGLGLEIAQGVAELHGGRIAVRNREEGGCEFTVTLPASNGVPFRRG